MAHTARWDDAIRLADCTGAIIFPDDGTLGCDGNHRNAWAALATMRTSYPRPPWSVVLEDDAQPVDGFLDQLDAVLAAAPTPIVSLYLGHSRPPTWQPWIRQQTIRATQADSCFIHCKRMLHAVGIAMHTRMIPDMLTAVADLDGLPMDEAITEYARGAGYAISYCWPSIIDHADGPTLVAHRDGRPRDEPRRAWRTGVRSAWHTKLLRQ